MLSGNHTGEGSYRVFELPKLSPADVRSCQIRLFSYSSATTATVPSLLEMLQCVLSARFVICQPDDPTSQSLASFWLTAFDSREVSRFVTSHDPGCGSAAFRLSIELGHSTICETVRQQARQPVARADISEQRHSLPHPQRYPQRPPIERYHPRMSDSLSQWSRNRQDSPVSAFRRIELN